VLAELADRRIKAPRDQLVESLRGRVKDYHRFMLQLHLAQVDALDAAILKIDQVVDAAITRMDEEVEAGQATFRSLISLLCTIPGVSILSRRRSWRKSAST
jgi:transposase